MTVHKKMARSERAKQFMPFAALKGYPEALRKEEEKVLRSYGEASREEAEEEEQKSVKTGGNAHRQNRSLSL